jgi:hypothetical protein
MDAVPNSDGSAVPESLNRPEILESLVGDVKFATGFALLIINVRNAVFEIRPLESYMLYVKRYVPLVQSVASNSQYGVVDEVEIQPSLSA